MAYRIKPKHVASNKTDKTLVVIDALRFLSAKTVFSVSRSG
jgi:hypothetical protein